MSILKSMSAKKAESPEGIEDEKCKRGRYGDRFIGVTDFAPG